MFFGGGLSVAVCVFTGISGLLCLFIGLSHVFSQGSQVFLVYS